MNTRRMTPAELSAIIDAAGITSRRAAEIAGVNVNDIHECAYFGIEDLPAPISKTLCARLLALGLATELARPWVPDDLAEVLAPTRAA